jgi:hypothetical protein
MIITAQFQIVPKRMPTSEYTKVRGGCWNAVAGGSLATGSRSNRGIQAALSSWNAPRPKEAS